MYKGNEIFVTKSSRITERRVSRCGDALGSGQLPSFALPKSGFERGYCRESYRPKYVEQSINQTIGQRSHQFSPRSCTRKQME